MELTNSNTKVERHLCEYFALIEKIQKLFDDLKHTENNYTILTKVCCNYSIKFDITEKCTCKHLVLSICGSPKPLTSVKTTCFSITTNQEQSGETLTNSKFSIFFSNQN